MKKQERMSSHEFREKYGIIQNNRKTSAIHKSNENADIQQTYDVAVQTLRNLQGVDGNLFCGSDSFTLWTKIFGKSNADGVNIYKGIEDSLNKIAWKDDKQNITFRKSVRFC